MDTVSCEVVFCCFYLKNVSLCVHKTDSSGTPFPVQGLDQEWGPLSNTVEVEADVSLMVGPPKGSDKQTLESAIVKDGQVVMFSGERTVACPQGLS